MVSQGSQEIFTAIRDVLLEEGKVKLTYSKLYEEVINKIAELRKENNKISYRDFSSVLDYMVKENKLYKEDSGKRGGKVYYHLTERSKREYQYQILGIDKEKERLRRLYHFLFFYEISNLGKRFLTENQLSSFLKEFSLSLKDFQPLTRGVAIDAIITRHRREQVDVFPLTHTTGFSPVKDVRLVKFEYEKKGGGIGVLYIIYLPGFSREEILNSNKKNNYYFHNEQSIYNDLTAEELERAFILLSRAGLIAPLSEFYGVEKRYTIGGKGLQELISDIWKIIKMKKHVMFLKFGTGNLDEKDKDWLSYLYGDDKNLEYILSNWKAEWETYQSLHADYDIENARKGVDLFRNNVDWRVEELNEKYQKVFEDYDFPLHVIKEIIQIC